MELYPKPAFFEVLNKHRFIPPSDVLVVKIWRKCRITGEFFIIFVDQEDFDRWKEGTPLEQVWPTLAVREIGMMMFGWTPAEWNHTHPDD